MDLFRVVPPGRYPAEDFPAYPAVVVLKHVLAKGLQIGSVAGVTVSLPYALVRGQPFGATLRHGLLMGPVYGVLANMMLLGYKTLEMDEEGVDDRAYRISRNAGQNSIDTHALVGGLAGATASAVLGKRGFFGSVVPATSFGIAVGCGIYGATMLAEEYNRTHARR
jgi:hypothetical protein